jgi:hypothetical protein
MFWELDLFLCLGEKVPTQMGTLERVTLKVTCDIQFPKCCILSLSFFLEY